MKVIGIQGTSSLRTCEQCDSIIQFEDNEIEWESGRHTNGKIDRLLCDSGFITCPNCSHKQWTRRR
jgi:hypothetical protein